MATNLNAASLNTRVTTIFQRWIATPTRRALDGLWHLLAFIIGGVVIGNLVVNVAFSMATTGTTGLADPRSWLVVRTLLSHPTESAVGLMAFLVVAILSFGCHTLSHKPPVPIVRLPPQLLEAYNLGRVQAISPTPNYIPQYRTFYIGRRIAESGEDADQAARMSVRMAVNLISTTATPGNKCGFCVTGRRMLGTTRLAWEAMKAERELSNWTFVDWPVDSESYGSVLDYLKQGGWSAVIWLDNLGKYLTGPNPRVLNYLPYALDERGIHYAIIATCRDYDYPAVKTVLGDLLAHLEVFPLGDITSNEADSLVAELSQSGSPPALHNQYDGTPGSIILGVTQMRDVVYPKLSTSSKQVLRAIKLLQSVGITDFPVTRVLSVANALFAPDVEDWSPALNELAGAGFIGQRATANGEALTLNATQGVYLGVAVLAYIGPGTAAEQDWPRLQESLMASHDAKALIRLADTFRAREKDLQAEQCYEAALRDLPRAARSLDWALARLGYAIVVSHRLDQAKRPELDTLMDQAENAFRDALEIVTVETYPDLWAEAQSGLAAVVRQSARTTRGPERRKKMLDEAAANCRAALRILRQDSTPDEWANTQLNLALTLQTHAQVTQDSRLKRDLLDNAISAHQKALEVYHDDDFPMRRVRTQRYLGEALLMRAESSTRKGELYQEAVAAFSNAVAILKLRSVHLPLIDINNGLGVALVGLATSQDDPSAAVSLGQAAEAFGAAADEYKRNQDTVPAAIAQYNQGIALQKQASHVGVEARPELLREAIETQEGVVTLLNQRGTHELHAQVHLELANLYWQRMTESQDAQDGAMSTSSDLDSVRKNAHRVVSYYAPDPNSELHRGAKRLLRDIKRLEKERGRVQSSKAP